MTNDILYKWDNREDAMHLIGKKVIGFEYYKQALHGWGGNYMILTSVGDSNVPFYSKKSTEGYQFIKEYKQKKKALIFDYKNIDGAKKYINCNGYFTNSIKLIDELKEDVVHSNNISNILFDYGKECKFRYRVANEEVLSNIMEDGYFPYVGYHGLFQFFIVFVDD